MTAVTPPRYELVTTEGISYHLDKNRNIAIVKTNTDGNKLNELIRRRPPMGVTVEVVPNMDDVRMSPNFKKELRDKSLNIEEIIETVTDGDLKRWSRNARRKRRKTGEYSRSFTDHNTMRITPEGKIDQGEFIPNDMGGYTRYSESSRGVSIPSTRYETIDIWTEREWVRYVTALSTTGLTLSLKRTHCHESEYGSNSVSYMGKIVDAAKNLIINSEHAIFRELYRTINRRFGYLTDLFGTQ